MISKALVTEFKRHTIESYARYVMDDPQVVAFIKRFKEYQRAADKVIDSFEGLVDNGLLNIESEGELADARAFNQSTEECKNRTLQGFIDDLGTSSFPIEYVILRDASHAHPNKTDVPLLIFSDFIRNEHFRDYLFKGSVDLLSGAYFAKDIDLARQKYLVFATFLWAFMKPVKVAITDEGGQKESDTYYVYDDKGAVFT